MKVIHWLIHLAKGCSENKDDIIYFSNGTMKCKKCGRITAYFVPKPLDVQSEIIKTCKGVWGSDKLERIKEIIGGYCGINTTDVCTSDVLYWIKPIYERYVKKENKQRFFEDLFRLKQSVTIEDVVAQMCGYITIIKVIEDNNKLLIDLNSNEEEEFKNG